MGTLTNRDWRDVAAYQTVRLLQMHAALQILRAWGGGVHSPAVSAAVHRWINAGMNGPVPWPDDPAFERWAARNGFANSGGFLVCGTVPARRSGKLH